MWSKQDITGAVVIFVVFSLMSGVLCGLGGVVGWLAVGALITASRKPNPMAQHSHREPKHRA